MFVKPETLARRLYLLKGATFASIQYYTQVPPDKLLKKNRLTKEPNPHKEIYKRSLSQVQFNFNYDAAVLRQLEREGKDPEEFDKGESWHDLVKDEEGRFTPFCQHKTNKILYLRLRILKSLQDTKYFDENKNELTFEQCQHYIPKPSTYDNQGVEDENVIRFITMKFDSVENLIINGTTYIVTNRENKETILTIEDLRNPNNDN